MQPREQLSYSRFCSSFRTAVKDYIVHPYVRGYWPACVSVEALSRTELLARQQQLLQSLLADAIAHVPFYRSWALEHGFTAGRLPDLHELPIVTKRDYMQDINGFQSDRFPLRQMRVAKTSGSSGEPFQFRVHSLGADYSYACLWRALSRHGIRPGDRRAYVWGRSYTFNSDANAIRKVQRRHRVRNWVNNTLAIDAYALSKNNVHEALARIEEFEPRYLHGYVSALYVLAQQLLEDGRDLKSLRLGAVVTESEKLYSFQRDAMMRAFACPVLEHYGSVEMGNIAQTDPDGRLRLNEDLHLVEALPTGEAVITHLHSNAYPFIRYRLGDIIRLSQDIEPSLPFGSLEEVTGRTVDLIPLEGGGFVHGVALAHIIDPHLRYVSKYQVRQTRLGEFNVAIVPHAEVPVTVSERIEHDLRNLVGQSARVTVSVVSQIPPDASGKFRWVVSELTQSEFQSNMAPQDRKQIGSRTGK